MALIAIALLAALPSASALGAPSPSTMGNSVLTLGNNILTTVIQIGGVSGCTSPGVGANGATICRGPEGEVIAAHTNTGVDSRAYVSVGPSGGDVSIGCCQAPMPVPAPTPRHDPFVGAHAGPNGVGAQATVAGTGGFIWQPLP